VSTSENKFEREREFEVQRSLKERSCNKVHGWARSDGGGKGT